MIEIIPLKKKGQQIPYFVVSVGTMVGDADAFPVYNTKFQTLDDEDELIIKRYQSESLSEEEEEKAESILELIYEAREYSGVGDKYEKWSEALFHYNGFTDSYEKIRYVKVSYFDENGAEHAVRII